MVLDGSNIAKALYFIDLAVHSNYRFFSKNYDKMDKHKKEQRSKGASWKHFSKCHVAINTLFKYINAPNIFPNVTKLSMSGIWNDNVRLLRQYVENVV